MATLPPVKLVSVEIFPKGGSGSETFFELTDWAYPVTYFVGQNGTGKSRTAKLIASRLGGRFLATDRLAGLSTYTNYGWTSVPSQEGHRGFPLGEQERNQARGFSQTSGSGIDEMYALKEQPEVWLRVAAFLQRSLNRVIELRETSGFLDPYVRVGAVEYSLLRDEGHGLRELFVLLTALYRTDWQLLVVDEPELHLHPAMVRLWLGELERECSRPDRRALVVSHEPTILRPKQASDLSAIWYFSQGRKPDRIIDSVLASQMDRVTASLQHNADLIGQIVFSPRPVLVEGVDDVSALSTSLARTQPAEVVAQTDLVECGGSGGVALWYEICKKMGLNVCAVADLDACFAQEVQRAMDAMPEVTERYRHEYHTEPPRTSGVLQPLTEQMRRANVPPDPKARSKWLANDVPADTGWAARIDGLLAIWRDAGLWLHPQGTLEDVLGTKTKGREAARRAAQSPGSIDAVAAWCGYKLDPSGAVFTLLRAAVERIAHSVMEALLTNPGMEFTAPVGGGSASDARLVDVQPRANGVHRLTVKQPAEFAGCWVEFSRDTPSTSLDLRPLEGRSEVPISPV